MKYLFAILLLTLPFAHATAGAPVVINPDSVVKRNVKGASGANIVYLLDSDATHPRPRSMRDALTLLGAGCLRFSEGHLADNYLWTVPPYDEAVNGLHPRIASAYAEPAHWEWAVDKRGFIRTGLDFDDYIALCRQVGAEPIITVNLLSCTYKGGPTREELIRSAAEWVRYANVVKKYGVRYWQLGNEVEKYDNEKAKTDRSYLLTEVLSEEQYCDLYGRMASAMMEVDPAIRVGTGVMGKPSWNKTVLNRWPHLVRFISCHQYAWGAPFGEGGYPAWKEYKGVHIPNIRKMENLLASSSAYRDIEILVTETGSTGGGWPEQLPDSGKRPRYVNDLYKALNNLEMNLAELSAPHVRYTCFWCTHTPWNGENCTVGLESLLDGNNDLTATGKTASLINRYLLPNILGTDYVQGYLRIRASASDNGDQITLFVINKGQRSEPFAFSIAGAETYTLVEKALFAGHSPYDTNPEIHSEPLHRQAGLFEARLPPCSATVFRLSRN